MTTVVDHAWDLLVWVIFTWVVVFQMLDESPCLTGVGTSVVVVRYVLFGPAPLNAYIDPFLQLYRFILLAP